MVKLKKNAPFYTQLAKLAVESYIKKRKIITVPENLPKYFLEKSSGVFVTLEENGELRGCIGTYLPVRENIAEEIIYNAIAAAVDDYRFGPVRREELPLISYEVSILSKPELIKSEQQLNPRKYGLIVKTNTFPVKSALLLPDLEGIDTIRSQIAIACRKGNINRRKEKITLYRFTVEKYI